MIDINKFCDPTDIRVFCRAPFLWDGKLFATDGKVMIYRPKSSDDCYEVADEDIGNRVSRIINIIQSADHWKPFVREGITLPEKIACECCEGTGKATKETCEECDGEGEVDVENGYSTYYGLECKSCGDEGYQSKRSKTETCPDCQGEGRRWQHYEVMTILDLQIQAKYFELIMNEPSLELAKVEGKEMLVFKTGETIGAIMGCRV